MPAPKPVSGTIQEPIDLGKLMGSTWAGFLLLPGDQENQHQGRFQHAYWRRAFEHGELCAMFYTTQEVRMHRQEVAQLRKEIEAANQRADEMELRTESRFGLMFTTPD